MRSALLFLVLLYGCGDTDFAETIPSTPPAPPAPSKPVTAVAPIIIVNNNPTKLEIESKPVRLYRYEKD